MKRAQPSTFRKRGSLLQRLEALERCPLFQHHDWEREARVHALAQLSPENLEFFGGVIADRERGIDTPVTPRLLQVSAAADAFLVIEREKRGLPPLRRTKKRR